MFYFLGPDATVVALAQIDFNLLYFFFVCFLLFTGTVCDVLPKHCWNKVLVRWFSITKMDRWIRAIH